MRKGHIFKYILLLTFLYFSGIYESTAARTIIKGRAPSYTGEKLVFYTYSNLISFEEIVLSECMVNDSGDFECMAELEEVRLIFTNLGIYNCLFYAVPGFIYQIRLPEKREQTEAEKANPYFEKVTIHLPVKPVGSTVGKTLPPAGEELNFLIRSFNDSFHPYYYKYVVNAYINNVNQQEINEAVSNITSPYEEINHPYFSNYIKYRIGLLIHYGAQHSSSSIINDYFKDENVHPYNTAYMELFNEVFTNYFELYTREHPHSGLVSIINRETDLDKILELFRKDKKLTNDTLIEMMLIKNLYECYYDQNYSKSSILILLDSLKSRSNIDHHKDIINDIKNRITKLVVESKAPPFELYDRDSNLVSLDDFTGRYVYLNFCNSFSYYCIMEFELLRDLKSRHQDHLSIITILVDDSFKAMQDLLKSNKYDWTFVHFFNQPEVLDNYDVQTYPIYYLIGPDGKLIASPAPSLSEGFESYLFKVMRSRGEI